MNTLTKRQILTLIVFIALLFALPVALFMTRKRQDIRPRATQGKANLLLKTDNKEISIGDESHVTVFTQLTDPEVRVSGVDFTLLYDKARLEVSEIEPSDVFTDVEVNSAGGNFDATYNFLRVAETVNKPYTELPKGSFSLASVTFRAIGEGDGNIKFPDDNKYLEIVGATP